MGVRTQGNELLQAYKLMSTGRMSRTRPFAHCGSKSQNGTWDGDMVLAPARTCQNPCPAKVKALMGVRTQGNELLQAYKLMPTGRMSRTRPFAHWGSRSQNGTSDGDMVLAPARSCQNPCPAKS